MPKKLWLLLVFAVVVAVVLLEWPRPAPAQTAQENIERTLGSLIVQNATCAAQGLGAAEELRKVKAELDAMKAKQPTAADPKPGSAKSQAPVSPLVKP